MPVDQTKDSRAASDRARAEEALAETIIVKSETQVIKDAAVSETTTIKSETQVIKDTAVLETTAIKSETQLLKDAAESAKVDSENARDISIQKSNIAVNAVDENMAILGVNPDYISYTIGVLPTKVGAVEGEIGAYYISTGRSFFQRLQLISGDWVPIGRPVLTLLQDAAGNYSQAMTGTGNEIDDSANCGSIQARNSKIIAFVERGAEPVNGAHTEGTLTKVYGWSGHAEGSGCIVDGKLSHAEGNGSVCTSNDAHAEGNRTVAGRKLYTISSKGVDTDPDVGTKPFVCKTINSIVR